MDLEGQVAMPQQPHVVKLYGTKELLEHMSGLWLPPALGTEGRWNFNHIGNILLLKLSGGCIRTYLS